MNVLIASLIDVLHAALMIVWVLGFPLLFWHGWPRLSRAFAWYSLAFVVVSQVSHWILGECVLTTLSRWFWQGAAASGHEPDVLFTVRFVNFVAGIRPSERVAVVAWEFAVVACSLGVLWYWHRVLRGRARGPAASRGLFQG